MSKFRKKPVEIEARQWDGTSPSAPPIIDWILDNGGTANYVCSNTDRCIATDGDCPHWIVIHTLEGDMQASAGDWIIRGVQGEFYPCKPDIFDATYESVPSIVIRCGTCNRRMHVSADTCCGHHPSPIVSTVMPPRQMMPPRQKDTW